MEHILTLHSRNSTGVYNISDDGWRGPGIVPAGTLTLTPTLQNTFDFLVLDM